MKSILINSQKVFVKKLWILTVLLGFSVSLMAQFGNTRYSTTASGTTGNYKVVMIGNSSIKISAALGDCLPVTEGNNEAAPDRDYGPPEYTKIDGENASAAIVTQDMLGINGCEAKVKYAFLYWAGSRKHTGGDTDANYRHWLKAIRIKGPGQAAYSAGFTCDYWEIPGPAGDGNNREPYYCVKDVSYLLAGQGAGTFTVADIQATLDQGGTQGGPTAAWSLVLVYESLDYPPTDFYLWDGIAYKNGGGSITKTTTFPAAPTGDISAFVGMATIDGDYDDDGEDVTFKANIGTLQDLNAMRATNDFLSSTMTYNAVQVERMPFCFNTLGYDAHHFDLPDGSVGTGATSATISINDIEGGSIYPFMMYMGIVKNQPELRVTKMASSPTVKFDQAFQYMVIAENIGGRATSSSGNTADKVIFTDTLDYNLDFSGLAADVSVKINGVVQGGYTVNWNGTTRELRITNLPQIPKDGTMVVSYKVKTKPASATEIWRMNCMHEIYNRAKINYKDDTGKSYTAFSGANGCDPPSYTVVPVIEDFEAIKSNDTIIKVVLGDDLPITAGNLTPYLRDVLGDHLGNITYINDFSFTKQNSANGSAIGNAVNAGNIADYTNTNGWYTATRTIATHPGNPCAESVETYRIQLLYCNINNVTLTAAKQNVVCKDSESGLIEVTTGGGQLPMTYILAKGTLANSGELNAGNTLDNITESSFQYTFKELAAGQYTVIVIDANGCEKSEGITPELIDNVPDITVDLTATSACVGNVITFTATPVGGVDSNYGYKWYRSDDNGTTWQEMEIQNDPAQYSVTSQSASVMMKAEAYSLTAECSDVHCAAENMLTVNLSQTPDLSVAPVAPICAGQTAAITVTDAKLQTISSYVWKQSTDSITWTVIGGATGANYTTPALSDTMYYRSIWTASGGCADSIDVKVIVNPQPIIANKTADICSGETFTVTPVNTLPDVVPAGTTYTWSAPSITGITGTTAGTDQSSISGTLTNTTSGDITLTYVVTPKIGSCTGTPFDVEVTVKAKPQITDITRTICSGTAFDATPVDGTDGIVPANTTYTWTVPTDNTNLDESAQPTAQTAIGQTLSIQNAAITQQTATYEVTPVSGTAPNTCAGTPFKVTISVNPLPTAVINSAPASICAGKTFTLDATATAGTVAWTHNGAGSFNATATAEDATYTSAAGDAGKTVTLTLTVTSNTTPNCGTDVKTYVLTVNPLPTATINTAAGGKTCSETGFTLSSTSTNGTPAWTGGTGTWTDANTDNPTYTPAAGEAGTTVTLTLTVTSNTTPACGTDVKTYALEVYAAFDAGAIAGTSEAVCHNSTTPVLTIGNTTAATGGNGTITYEWFKDGVSVGSSNSTTYTIPDADRVNTGTADVVYTYTRKAKDGLCNTTFELSDEEFKLTVYPEFKAGAIETAGQEICDGEAILPIGSDVDASGGHGTISYRWFKDAAATPIAGATSASYTPTEAGTYRREAKDATCVDWQKSTGTWELTIKPVPKINNATLLEQLVCSGESSSGLTLTADVAGTTFAWTTSSFSGVTGHTASGNGDIPAEMLSTMYANTDTLYYTITPTADGCTGSPVTYKIPVRICSDLVLKYTLSPEDICLNSTTKLTLTVENRASIQATGVVVKIDMPSQLNFTPESVDGIYDPTIGWTVGTIAAGPGTTANITFELDGTTAGNDIDILAYIAEANGTVNNPDYISVTVEDQRDSIALSVFPLPTAILSGDTTICSGSTSGTAVKIDFTGKAPFKFTYSDGSTTSSEITANATPYILLLDPLVTTAYNLVSVTDANNCAAATPSGAANITVTDKPTLSGGSLPAAICENNPLDLTGKEPTVNDNGAAIIRQGWLLDGTIYTGTNVTHAAHNGKELKYYAINACDSVTLSLGNVTIDKAITLNAGTDQTITCACATGSVTATMAATNDVGTGVWTKKAGTTEGTITDVNLKGTTITDLPVGVHTFVWIVTNGTCTATDEVTITVQADNTAPTFSLTATDSIATSAGSCIFQVPDLENLVTAKSDDCSSESGITYRQDPAIGTVITANTVVSIYLKDSCNNESVAQTVTVKIPTALTVSNTVKNPLCVTDEASAEVIISGGTAPYEYSFTATFPGTVIESGDSIHNLTADQTLTVQDADGCSATSNIDITIPTNITGTVTPSDALTPGGSEGSLKVTSTTGGNGGSYEYKYVMTTMDGLSDSIQVYPATGWTIDDETTATLKAGTYNIYARNVAGCEFLIDTEIITDPGDIKGTVATDSVSCNGLSDGAIRATVTEGGTPDYQVILDKHDGTNYIEQTALTKTGVAEDVEQTFGSLAAGTYRIRVIDANSAPAIIATGIKVGEPATITVSKKVSSDVSCNGGNTGKLELQATGGNPGGYYFSAGLTTADNYNAALNDSAFSNLTAGTYTIKAKDAKGCVGTSTVQINEPAKLALTYTVSNPECSTGTATVTLVPTGGSGAYKYKLDGEASWTTFAPGVYTIPNLVSDTAFTLSDANDCELDTVITGVVIPQAVTFTAAKDKDVSCYGGNNGQITVTSATGGSGTYQYSKDNGATWQNTNVFTGLTATTYNVLVKDSKDCEAAAQPIVITQPTQLTATATKTDALCPGGVGSITMTISGGSPDASSNYEYSLNGGAWTAIAGGGTISNVSVGAYSINVRDTSHCEIVTPITDTIVATDAIAPTIASSIPATPATEGLCQFVVPDVITAVRAVSTDNCTAQPDLVIVQTPADGSVITSNTVVTVSVKDAVGNESTTTVQITVPVMPELTFNPLADICENEAPRIIVASNDQSLAGVYSGAGITGNSFDPAAAGVGTHTITYTVNAYGCVLTATQTIKVNEVPSILGALEDKYCQENAKLELGKIFHASSGILNWYATSFGGATIPAPVIDRNIIASSTYYVQAQSNNCRSDIEEIATEIVEKPSISSIVPDITIGTTVTMATGQSPFEFLVYGPNITGNSYSNIVDLGLIPYGQHIVSITDANNCATEATFFVDAVPLIPDAWFSPNGDGERDLWKVQNIELYPESEIFIHDRYGKELLKLNAKDFVGWNGKYLGNDMPSTDYWYVIMVRETGERMVGHFLLKR